MQGMTTKALSRLSGRGAVVLCLQAGGQALTFAAHVLLARAGGAASYGAFAVVVALVNVVVTFARLGQDLVLLRFVSSLSALGRWSELKATWKGSNRIVAIVSVVAGLGIAVFGQLPHVLPPSVSGVPLLLGAATVPLLALGTLRFSALLAFDRPFLAQLGENVIRPAILASFALAALLFTVSVSSLSMLVVNGLAALTAFAFAQLQVGRWIPSDKSSAGTSVEIPALGTGIWMLIATGAYQALTQVDILVVGAQLGEKAAGIYAAANRLSLAVQAGMVALQWVVAPQLAASHAKRDFATMQALLRKVALLSTGFSFVVAAVIIPGAELLMRLFGSDFEAGATALRLFALSNVINAAIGVTGSVLIMAGQHRINAVITATHLCLELALLMFVVPRYSLTGAAVATTCVLASTQLSMAWAVKRRLGLRSWLTV